MTTTHIPAFRFGEDYQSLDQATLTHFRDDEAFAAVSQVNAGIIRRDRRKIPAAFAELQRIRVEDMLSICHKAGNLFLEGTLPVSGEIQQSPGEYAEVLSKSCGLPVSLVHTNMHKISHVLTHMPEVLNGLTRGLDLGVLDEGMALQDDLMLSFYPAATCLGAVLPSNSPGVNSLWLPAVALRIPVMLKPGREDPWTPWRIIQAFIAAGCPPSAFGFYPTDHEGASAVIDTCDRALLFGDANTVAQYASNPAVSVHGPGYSKVLIGEDVIDRWPDYLDMLADSIALNGGRSCVNASTIVVPRKAHELAEALADKLAAISPLPLEDEKAQLAAFINPAMAEAIDTKIEEALKQPGATDLTAARRNAPRRVEMDGATFLQPTLVPCTNPEHPLAKTEMLMPFASVVEIPQADMLAWIGPTLVATVITEDAEFRRAALACPHIDRLNLGSIPTPSVKWDQPHEGNLFEFLYNRRAIQEG